MMSEENCICLETEYKKATVKWRFLCSCGNEDELLPQQFRVKKSCTLCYKKKRKEKYPSFKGQGLTRQELKEKTYLRIKEMFEEAGCVCLELEWKSTNSLWDYICNCGYKSSIRPSEFEAGQRCRDCGMKNRGISNAYSKEEILDFLREGDTYINHFIENSSTRLAYKCSNGHVRNVGAAAYKSRDQCLYCFREFQRGENHPNWNPLKTREQRIQDRKHLKTEHWRKEVFERDNYTCQKCGQYGWDLNAHHIFSFRDYEDRRLDASNGITLCEFCHKWFHWEYGSHYETTQDFYNYMNW